mmetsp:Transcript_36072/g.65412  ORF Transcript_36072/g.65412 Transcript_36072/m.65412 type:complete len:86 (+) Transcript_36072:88-345(+)
MVLCFIPPDQGLRTSVLHCPSAPMSAHAPVKWQFKGSVTEDEAAATAAPAQVLVLCRLVVCCTVSFCWWRSNIQWGNVTARESCV